MVHILRALTGVLVQILRLTPASFGMVLAVLREVTVTATGKRLPLIGLCHHSWRQQHAQLRVKTTAHALSQRAPARRLQLLKDKAEGNGSVILITDGCLAASSQSPPPWQAMSPTDS